MPLLLLLRAASAFPTLLLVNTLAVAVAGPSRVRRAAALALTGLCWAIAALLPPPIPMLRGWMVFAAVMLTMRVVDVLGMVASPRLRTTPPTLADRITHLLLIYDRRDMIPALPHFAFEIVARGLLYGVLALAPLYVASVTTGPLRWLCGGVHIYAFLELADSVFRTFHAALGLRSRPLQLAPLRSRTLAELWGRRWNREVGRWIHRWCFTPLARRGHPALGVLAGFAWSGFFHGAAVWAAVGLGPGLMMGSFFLVHGVAVLAERAIGISLWPRWASHGWTVSVCLLTLPLFAEPLLQLTGL